MKCVFTLDDFCFAYKNVLPFLDDLHKHFDNFVMSSFTIPCYNGDYLSNHRDFMDSLPTYMEHIIHGWNHNTHEFMDLSYEECRDKLTLAINEFKICGLPIISGFKAPNWRYNKSLVKALKELNFWIAPYTEGQYNSIAGDIVIPLHLWNWDINNDIPDAEIIVAHGHVHSCSGPGANLADCVENIKKQLPKDTEFIFASKAPLQLKIKQNEVVAKDRDRIIIEKREKSIQQKADRWNANINVLITGHHDQRIFMDACVDSVKGLGWCLMTYDNPEDFNNRLPKNHIMKKLDQFFIKHPTREMPGPTYPQFWNFKHGCEILNGSDGKYIFVIGADSILERPEGLTEIMDMLGNGDIISCSTRNPERHKIPYCNTKSFLATKEAFTAIMALIQKTFVPFDHRFGNMESRFGMAVKELNLNEIIVPELPSEDQFAYDYDDDGKCINRGTWGKVLGYRHLGGEHKRRRLHRAIPIEEKYFDIDYLRRYELDTMVKYWKTQDIKFLEAWWDSK